MIGAFVLDIQTLSRCASGRIHKPCTGPVLVGLKRPVQQLANQIRTCTACLYFGASLVFVWEGLMTATASIPAKIFKYRSFGDRTLDCLVADQLFFADPSTFNDPLDTKPAVETDLGVEKLSQILGRLVENRISAEMTAAANMIKYKGPKTLDHIAAHSRKAAQKTIAEIRYFAADRELDGQAADGAADQAQDLFARYIEDELLRRYDKGVVSFAGRSECPLMWSHYGDQHRGLCIGYSIPTAAQCDLHKISYGGSRTIEASAVNAMLEGDAHARAQVDKAVLTRKAASWRYEKEWRLLGLRGLQRSPLELEEIIFGMRCPDAVRFAILKALTTRSRAVKFYEIREKCGSFLLEKRALQIGELVASFPIRALDAGEGFEPIEMENGRSPLTQGESTPRPRPGQLPM